MRREDPASASAPPWEVVILVSQYLNPSSLAISSCVSKSWQTAMSSPKLWLPLCLSLFPSSSHLLSLSPPPSPRLLFSLLKLASRRIPPPPPPSPLLSPDDLLFTLDIFLPNITSPLISIAVEGEHLQNHGYNAFRFDVNLSPAAASVVEKEQVVRVVWMAVMKGWEGAFVILDREGKGVDGKETGLWFDEEIDGLNCCDTAADRGGMVAEVGLQFSGDGRSEYKVHFRLSRRDVIRYVSLRDGLAFLQSRLLPPPTMIG